MAKKTTGAGPAPKFVIDGIPYETDADLPSGATFSGGAAEDIDLVIGSAEYILQDRGETKVYRRVR